MCYQDNHIWKKRQFLCVSLGNSFSIHCKVYIYFEILLLKGTAFLYSPHINEANENNSAGHVFPTAFSLLLSALSSEDLTLCISKRIILLHVFFTNILFTYLALALFHLPVHRLNALSMFFALMSMDQFAIMDNLDF